MNPFSAQVNRKHEQEKPKAENKLIRPMELFILKIMESLSFQPKIVQCLDLSLDALLPFFREVLDFEHNQKENARQNIACQTPRLVTSFYLELR